MTQNTKAFPIVAHHEVYATGMDLRDWFAGQALMGLISYYGSEDKSAGARAAYDFADAMMAAREVKNDTE